MDKKHAVEPRLLENKYVRADGTENNLEDKKFLTPHALMFNIANAYGFSLMLNLLHHCTCREANSSSPSHFQVTVLVY